MKKFINVSLVSLAAVLVISTAVTASVPSSYSYYDCPSMSKYSPAVTSVDYCRTGESLKASEYTACVKEYQKTYGKARQEYRLGKCEINETKYVERVYGAARCKVEYTTTGKTPKIVDVSSKTMVKGRSDDAKCIARVKAVLKKAYPDIEE